MAQTSSEPLPFDDLYDFLMVDIEPELTTSMLPELDAIYKQESAEDRRARGKRYARAFEIFADRLETFLSLWKREILAFKTHLLSQFQERVEAAEAQALSEIERSLDAQ
jgi:hypothetical protein